MGPSFIHWEWRRVSQARGEPGLLCLPVCVCVCVCVHMCRGYPGSPWVPEERWGLSYPIRARKAIPPMGYSQDQRVHLAVSDSVLEKGPISFYRASLDFAKNCQAFKIQPLLTHITHWTLPLISPRAFTLAPLKHGAVPTSKLCTAVKSNPQFRTCRLQIDTLENCLVAKARNICYKVALPVEVPLEDHYQITWKKRPQGATGPFSFGIADSKQSFKISGLWCFLSIIS